MYNSAKSATNLFTTNRKHEGDTAWKKNEVIEK